MNRLDLRDYPRERLTPAFLGRNTRWTEEQWVPAWRALVYRRDWPQVAKWLNDVGPDMWRTVQGALGEAPTIQLDNPVRQLRQFRRGITRRAIVWAVVGVVLAVVLVASVKAYQATHASQPWPPLSATVEMADQPPPPRQVEVTFAAAYGEIVSTTVDGVAVPSSERYYVEPGVVATVTVQALDRKHPAACGIVLDGTLATSGHQPKVGKVVTCVVKVPS